MFRSSPPVILSLVERGYQAARTCSIDLQSEGLSVIHLIKGGLSSEIRALIVPYPHIRMVAVGRHSFRLFLWSILLGLLLTRRLRTIWVDNERSDKQLHRWLQGMVDVLRIQQGTDGYELWRGSQKISP